MRRRKKALERRLAEERIHRLVALAERRLRDRPDLAVRYVRLARRIGMRYQVSLPRDVRRRVCRSCERLLVAGLTARVRLTGSRMSVTCLACGTVKRYPYTRPRAAPVKREVVAA